MLQTSLQKILLVVVAVNVFAVGILFVFLFNFRMNIRRRVSEREFALRMLMAIKKSDNTEQVAKQTGLSIAEVNAYCHTHGLETPEEAVARIEAVNHRKEEEDRRIAAEEATWRAEQERINEERIREKELESKRRHERLKKFGIV